jgi:hypothetical protein
MEVKSMRKMLRLKWWHQRLKNLQFSGNHQHGCTSDDPCATLGCCSQVVLQLNVAVMTISVVF